MTTTISAEEHDGRRRSTVWKSRTELVLFFSTCTSRHKVGFSGVVGGISPLPKKGGAKWLVVD